MGTGEEIAKETIGSITDYATKQEDPITFIAIVLLLFVLVVGVAALVALIYFGFVTTRDNKSFHDFLKEKAIEFTSSQNLHIREAAEKKKIIDDTHEIVKENNTLLKTISSKV